ncbi:MAG: methyltransferase domain-containing protein [Nitrospirota bacterium]
MFRSHHSGNGQETIAPARIYISEQVTPLYKWFIYNYLNVTGSEYLGEEIPFGKKNIKGIRNEDITELSFSDNQFDFVFSFDVFEHIPDFQKAFRKAFLRFLLN